MNTGDSVGVGMPARDRTRWAKETLIDWIDASRTEDTLEIRTLDFDQRHELLRQRNRVAKIFGLPEVRR
jgi:hypothetical protein